MNHHEDRGDWMYTISTPSTNLGNRIKQKKAEWLTIISFSHMMKDNGLCEKTTKKLI